MLTNACYSTSTFSVLHWWNLKVQDPELVFSSAILKNWIRNLKEYCGTWNWNRNIWDLEPEFAAAFPFDHPFGLWVYLFQRLPVAKFKIF